MLAMKPVVILVAAMMASFAMLVNYIVSPLLGESLLGQLLLFFILFLGAIVSYQLLSLKRSKNHQYTAMRVLGVTLTEQNIAEAIVQLKDNITQSGERIDKKASELAINSAQVSYFLGELAKAIQASSDDVDRLATAAEQMSSNTNQINDNASIASQQANQAMTSTQQGVELLSGNVVTIKRLNEDVAVASDKITSLAEKATEIQNITNVIDAISEQTNLLALNAAIEAARAGEQGRGFAVVADEVRALAGKTADATEQIAQMLKQVSSETHASTQVMSAVVKQSEQVVEEMENLSDSLLQTNQVMAEASSASDQISFALQEHNATTDEISSAITNIHDFLLTKGQETQQASEQSEQLANCTEAIFVELTDFDTHSITDKMAKIAQQSASKVGQLFADKIKSGEITEQALFNFNYRKIAGTDPQKYSTDFDRFTDQLLPNIQEPILTEHKQVIYAGAVDINGYFPTHNNCFSQPLTGDYQIDMIHNRTKRIFDDATGRRCGSHQQKFLLQTYQRDTGEIMHDVSAPIFVNGKHWGGFRLGFKAT
ncbi:methyl-accepting chemotaxis protein [Thalassotalea sp. G2M2-11]|uniref:methyl-accepting chemotaxis protein n=1 Tax=Thalassotalea sp. G2M2-11 TaxID=2787627 RepID=UPI001F49ADC4|nr:methyl-accepting chemotaxis protein [Thalassotalea sp. G2M2-11]